jgi:nucleoside-diphosphate-sugar epimerase
MPDPRPAIGSTARPSEIIYVGEDEFFGPELVKVIEAAGRHIRCFLDVESASEAVNQPCWASHAEAGGCILIAFQLAAKDIRALAELLGNSIEQFVLISSYKVYPPVFRPSPWRPEDFSAAVDGVARADDATMVGQARCAERELMLRGHHLKAWTILRPALIEGINNPHGHSAWLVNRILDEGVVVLPDRKMTIYRHVSVSDLARAVLAVAGKQAAFGAVVNVVSRSMLTYRGHTRLLAKALKRRITFGYVSHELWQAMALPAPIAEDLSASFIAASELLSDLGWEPSDEVEFFSELAQALKEFPRFTNRSVQSLERQLYAHVKGDSAVRRGREPGHDRAVRNRPWAFIARPGAPNSLTLRPFDFTRQLAMPVLKMRRLAFGRLETGLLRGEFAAAGAPRIIGHNALFEVVHSSHPGLAVGSKVVPLARVPCGDRACCACADARPKTFGLDCDGYGRSLSSMPPQHLISVASDLLSVALLANPLAALIETAEKIPLDTLKTVWMWGSSVETALLSWIMEDAKLQVVIVGRGSKPHHEFPVHDINECVDKANDDKASRPDLFVDFTGNFEAASMINPAHNSFQGFKGWCGSHRPPRLPPEVPLYGLPVVATAKSSMMRALNLLKSWSRWRDVGLLIGPTIKLDAYWDNLMPPQFVQPYIEVGD